ncbi:MAG: cation diffusion facilitator family transporter [Acidimicrobiia bacterium]
MNEHPHHADSHTHDHDPGRETRQGVGARLAHLFRPHSHDHAESIDSALTASEEGMRALKISLVGLGVTALAQVVIYAMSGSVALLADTIHNFSDALTAVPLAIAFVLARRAPTRRYTYGYGRAEDLAGLFIVAMIALSAVVALWQSAGRLVDPEPIDAVGWVLAAGVVGFVGNELVASYRIRVGRRIGSAALVADGLHARTDGLTSLAVVGAAIGSAMGAPILDPVIGIGIGLAILGVLRRAARDIYRRLMDSVDPELPDQIEAGLAAHPEVRSVDRVRVRWIGHELHADAEVTVDAGLSVAAGHDILERARHELLHGIHRLADVHLHANPSAVDGVDAHGLTRHHFP